ncbi:MAG: MoxR family ATPase [Verrucomicrobiota bacterium]|nr:MoxR family ATPase [Verrucomicrobiota bacterium]
MTAITTAESTLTEEQVARLAEVPETYAAMAVELGKRIVGQDEVIRDLFVALLVQGHCLMIGVPGLAKTMMIRTLAEILDLQFRRIQFTPDLMPSDITGSEIIEDSADGGRVFRFVSGAIFTQMLLADEINRTPPKTQAALLEAMQERRVTIAGQTYDLPSPFFVLATQNPIEQEGTYPLPEAQLDRFMFNLRVGYPTHDEEVEILLRTTLDGDAPLQKLLDGGDIRELQHAVRQIPVPRSVADYAVRLVQSTRPGQNGAPDFVQRYLQWGAGPRASQYLALAGKSLAALDGRFNVAREDVQAAAKLVLRHRLITNYHAEAESVTVDQIIERLV